MQDVELLQELNSNPNKGLEYLIEQYSGLVYYIINAIGYYPEYDDQNRIKSISYMLNRFDRNEISIKLTNPRYVIMEDYQLTINPNIN